MAKVTTGTYRDLQKNLRIYCIRKLFNVDLFSLNHHLCDESGDIYQYRKLFESSKLALLQK